MDVIAVLEEVSSVETRSGNARFVARDSEGREYTTFREAIGERARQLQGRRVRIEYHEVQKGRYTNVYLDKLEAVEDDAGPSLETDVQEAAWRTAVEAAPWLVGQPRKEIAPDDLYEKLKPFEERVAADIEERRKDTSSGD